MVKVFLKSIVTPVNKSIDNLSKSVKNKWKFYLEYPAGQ